VVWIAEGEDGNTIKTALDAVARNVPCESLKCEHKPVHKWLQLPSGKRMYMQSLSCFPDSGRNPDFRPWVSHDKHVPTFDAVFQSHFSGSLLDPWHAHKAVSDHVTKVVGVSKEAAHALDWGMRIYRRSLSDAQAEFMRMCLVEYILSQCEGENPLWTPVQASKIIAYIDTYWHFNHRVRAAFIDKNFLMLKLDLGCTAVASTGSAESSHVHWDKITMDGIQNKSVLNVVKKVVGISPDGSRIPGYFNDERNRCLTAGCL